MEYFARLLTPKGLPFLSPNARARSDDSDDTFVGLEHWDVLGPFQIGTRESTWGADCLEFYGGFRSLTAHDGEHYPSSVAPGGRATWSKQSLYISEHSQEVIEVKGSFSFPKVDWEWLQSVYGWSARQYQGWARTELNCRADSAQQVAIFTDNVLEFWIDDQHFFGGDFYAYRRAPAIVSITPGSHRLDVRLTRDVRAMGGSGVPDHPVALRLEICPGDIRCNQSQILVPEMVADRGLSSPYGFIPLCNTTIEHIYVQDIHSLGDRVAVTKLSREPFTLVPGQSRPFGFRMETKLRTGLDLHLVLVYTKGPSEQVLSLHVKATIACRTIDEAIKSTFWHPGGLISYSIILPPREHDNTLAKESTPLPVLLNLHGAGLEADSHQVRHQMDAVEPVNAWTLFPTGVTAWSGDDWHIWGSRDIHAAVQSISAWIEAMDWKGPGVNLNQWYITGHSNGGQGTWFIATHKPDLVVAAAPVAGYSSIQAYVDYNLWTEMEPSIWRCIQASLANYYHGLLLSNTSGIDILIQHGSVDDNVPTHHSRRMHHILQLLGHPSRYYELPGKGHWFDGIMTTEPLRRFYQEISSSAKKDVPSSFRFVVPNTDAMWSCGGIGVDQLSRSGDFGSINVDRQDDKSRWHLRTSNIRRFRLCVGIIGTVPSEIVVDGKAFRDVDANNYHFVRAHPGTWELIGNASWERSKERSGRQRGAMDSILQTNGAFKIRYSPPLEPQIALQISRNLFQYFGADTKVISNLRREFGSGNSVILTKGDQVDSLQWEGPISVSSFGIRIVNCTGESHYYPALRGLGIIYIAPLPDEALELRIWGSDLCGLEQAARMVPMLTGVGQPDFIVVDNECRLKGAAGVKSLGFFDYDWQVSQHSYLSGCSQSEKHHDAPNVTGRAI